VIRISPSADLELLDGGFEKIYSTLCGLLWYVCPFLSKTELDRIGLVRAIPPNAATQPLQFEQLVACYSILKLSKLVLGE
jgi:hypothetical protein